MRLQIDIENCQECPYSWPHTNTAGTKTWVCDKLQDNIGKGDAVCRECPLVEGEQDG
jgi:hypothetical protein